MESKHRFSFIDEWHISGERVDLVRQHGPKAFAVFAKAHYSAWLTCMMPIGAPITLSQSELVDLCESLWACGAADDGRIKANIEELVNQWRINSPAAEDLQEALVAMSRPEHIQIELQFEGERGSGCFRVYQRGWHFGELRGGHNRWLVTPEHRCEPFYVSGSRLKAAHALYWLGLKQPPVIELAR